MKHLERGGVIIQLVIYLFFIVVALGLIQHFFDPIGKFHASEDKQRVQDLISIQHALDQYYSYHGRYPDSDSTYHIIDLTNKPVAWGAVWNPYMQNVPKDASTDRNYAYVVSSDKQAYFLYASLDNPKANHSLCNGACANAPANACGETVVCNYGLSSSNVSP